MLHLFLVRHTEVGIYLDSNILVQLDILKDHNSECFFILKGFIPKGCYSKVFLSLKVIIDFYS